MKINTTIFYFRRSCSSCSWADQFLKNNVIDELAKIHESEMNHASPHHYNFNPTELIVTQIKNYTKNYKFYNHKN